MTAACPDQGIYYNVPFAEYAAWDAMNASTLCEAFHDDGLSMQRLEAVLSGRLKRKETDALRFGRALHTRLLEPSLFDDQWPVAKPCSEIVGSGKTKGKICGKPGWKTNGSGLWLCGHHNLDGYVEPENYLTADEASRINKMRSRLMADREGRHLHKLRGSEVSIVFDSCGLRCKARIDKYGPGNGIIPDIKKFAADRLTQHRWETAVNDFHYDVKAAFYVDGIKALTGEDNEFWWVVLEDNEPYHVAMIPCQDDTLKIGRAKYEQALAAYKRCKESGDWPSPFPSVIRTWQMPRHVLYQYREMGVI